MKPRSLILLFICIAFSSNAQDEAGSIDNTYLNYLEKNFRHFKGYRYTQMDLDAAHCFIAKNDTMWQTGTSLITSFRSKKEYKEVNARLKSAKGYLGTDSLIVDNKTFYYTIYQDKDKIKYYSTELVPNNFYVLEFTLILSPNSTALTPLLDYAHFIRQNLKLHKEFIKTTME
jgi:hypothetical protein